MYRLYLGVVSPSPIRINAKGTVGMTDNKAGGIVATRREDVAASIARSAPPLTDAARARLALLLKPAASR